MVYIIIAKICNNLHQIIIMSFQYHIRICQWMWTVHLWEMADIVDGHTQAPGKHLKWVAMCQTQLSSKHHHLFLTIYFVL